MFRFLSLPPLFPPLPPSFTPSVNPIFPFTLPPSLLTPLSPSLHLSLLSLLVLLSHVPHPSFHIPFLPCVIVDKVYLFNLFVSYFSFHHDIEKLKAIAGITPDIDYIYIQQYSNNYLQILFIKQIHYSVTKSKLI